MGPISPRTGRERQTNRPSEHLKRANQSIPPAVELTGGKNTPFQGVFPQTLKERIDFGAVGLINWTNSIVFHGNRPDIGLGNKGQNVKTVKRLSHGRHHRTNKRIINIR